MSSWAHPKKDSPGEPSLTGAIRVVEVGYIRRPADDPLRSTSLVLLMPEGLSVKTIAGHRDTSTARLSAMRHHA